MPQLAIIADDLTGAADTSACFADADLSVAIPLDAGYLPATDVLALTTESRDLPAAAAARVVGEAFGGLRDSRGQRPPWLYKKIDSALRGHPREELLAAMAATGAARAIVAPALPAEGRTTIGGRQHIDGVPLEESHFARAGATSDLTRVFANDRGLPVAPLDLAAIRQGPDAVSRHLAQNDRGIIVADAETDEDLLILARAVPESPSLILCGAAGFARQLARALPLTPRAARPVAIRETDRPVLVVAGSQHAATCRQIALLEASGTPGVRLTQAMLDDAGASVAPIVEEVATHLSRGEAAVVTTAGLAPSSRGERTVAARLAEVAAAPAVAENAGGMVLTGGDVAAAVCSALGANAIWLGGEIYAGQPWGVLEEGRLPGLPVATKAGSFGGEGAFQACVTFLQHVARTT